MKINLQYRPFSDVDNMKLLHALTGTTLNTKASTHLNLG